MSLEVVLQLITLGTLAVTVLASGKFLWWWMGRIQADIEALKADLKRHFDNGINLRVDGLDGRLARMETRCEMRHGGGNG
jgi:hypothetical protein